VGVGDDDLGIEAATVRCTDVAAFRGAVVSWAGDLPKLGASHAQRVRLVVETHVSDHESGFTIAAVVGKALDELRGPVARRLRATVLGAPPLQELPRAARLVEPCITERRAVVRCGCAQRQDHGREEIAWRTAHAKCNGRNVLQMRIAEVGEREVECIRQLATQRVGEGEFAKARMCDEQVGDGVLADAGVTGERDEMVKGGSMIALCAMSRSRFLVNTLSTQTASSIVRPMNQRCRRLYWVCSMR
jgi:hypothetical protein